MIDHVAMRGKNARPVGPFPERCLELGLVAFRAVRPGTFRACATSSDAAADLMRASATMELVARAERADGEVAEGDGLLALALRSRVRPTDRPSWIVVASTGEGSLGPAHAPIAYTRERLAAMGPALASMLGDADELLDHRDANQGFTVQLTNSYETINLLYSIGKAMNDPDYPDRFVRLVCERLHEAGEFGWAAACFGRRPGMPDVLAGRTIRVGKAPGAPWFEHAARVVLARLGADPTCRVLADEHGLSHASFPHVLAQPLQVEGHTVGVLLAGDKEGGDPTLSSYDIQLVEAAGRYVSTFLSTCTLYSAQKAMFVGTVRALSAAIDAKDSYTRGHSDRVAAMARRLALAAGLDLAEADRIHIGGLVHDVGKIGVPEAVLCKQGRLTEEEFAVIKTHPEVGYTILQRIPSLADVLPGVLHHHERFDGRGYPRGLSGTDIPLIARIIAVADTFDAMSSNRSYRAAMPRERVLAEIANCAGSQFDPDLAKAFVQLDLSEYDRMVEEHERQDRRAA